ncbi:MAG: glycosyltransferase family 39 protein [Bacteroidia bacterium]
MQNIDYKRISFLFFFFSLTLLLFLPHFMARPMFLDGVTYATIARNMSEGIGNFWFPQYTCLRNEPFHIQPPLAFGLNSILFRIFGDADWVEKVYSYLTLCVSLFLITRLWHFFTKSLTLAGLPLLLWLLTPIVAWCYRNNMLENTVNVFALASILFQLTATEKANITQKASPLALAALFLLAGFLTKGLVALFPLATLPLYYFTVKKGSFRELFQSLALFLACFLVLILLLVFLQAAALENLKAYFTAVNKMLHEKTTDTHLFMLYRLLQESLVTVAFFLFAWIVTKRKQISRPIHKESLFLFFMACAASLPMMISLRQSQYYVMPAMIYVALGAALWIRPIVLFIWEKITHFQLHLWNLLNLLLLGVALFLSYQQKDALLYAHETFEDVQKISKIHPSRKVLKACYQLETAYELKAYLYRYHHITLDTDLYNEIKPDTVLLPNYEGCSFIDMPTYEQANLGLKKYHLYVKKK